MTTKNDLAQFFERRGWEPLPFQREVWKAMAEGKSGLVHSSTGTGKTLSVWLGFLALEPKGEGLKAVWLTPLRSLAGDTQKALHQACMEMGLDWRIELRTGDTSSYAKQKQVKSAPDCLITTPESLTLLLASKNSFRFFQGLQLVVVDEWHELLGSKRGVQTELALARLRTISKDVRVWGLSATLGNTQEAGSVLNPGGGEVIRGESSKEVLIDSLLPREVERFPWSGHIGVRMVKEVAEDLRLVRSSLIFTNTRAQAEIWYQELLSQCPDLSGQIALHHGSLDRDERERVEQGLKQGNLRAVICTSSLDLGVDFSPVDRVFQVGSPKGVARLMQKAGRSGHAPGLPSRITCVPTHALEVLDICASRRGAKLGRIEGREVYSMPFDVLSQHLVSMALAGGFREEKLRAEVRQTFTYRGLSDDEWRWALEFVTKGGSSLESYPEFHKVVPDQGVFLVPDRQVALRHRTNIGTIVSENQILVKYLTGGTLGTVEESFVSRLKKGDVFVFGGKALEFLLVKEHTCYVRRAAKPKGVVPRWSGGRMPLSSQLSHTLREIVAEIKHGIVEEPEIQAFAPLFALQLEWSSLPDRDEILVEQVRTREGSHLFVYPIEGRLVHEGLAALFATRLSRLAPRSFSVACNDYGFELLSPEPIEMSQEILTALVSTENLSEDILASLNETEMAKRQFREVARIAGLIFSGYPGQKKSARQVQASSGLFFDVFRKYDPGHPLLNQAQREVLERSLEQTRLMACLNRMASARLLLTHPPKPTPFAFPILVDRLRETIGSQSIDDRIQKMIADAERGLP
ncbi:MAG: ligase-associated DNA damage response DEXH box helicase [Fimbriimonadaceae bacterium]|nr:ligase-associated DNA damage response DEXH box helicase [Fimbriimonadaceae bacterium]